MSDFTDEQFSNIPQTVNASNKPLNKPNWGKLTRQGAFIAADYYLNDDREFSLKRACNKAAYEVHCKSEMIMAYLAGVGARVLNGGRDESISDICGKCQYFDNNSSMPTMDGYCYCPSGDIEFTISPNDNCYILQQRIEDAKAVLAALLTLDD